MTREEAIKILSTRDAHGVLCGYTSGVTEALDMAIEALSADAVSLTGTMKYLTKPHNYCEVVRCKDCIHWKADNEVFELGFCCVFPQKWVAETFYCADGERRE